MLVSSHPCCGNILLPKLQVAIRKYSNLFVNHTAHTYSNTNGALEPENRLKYRNGTSVVVVGCCC